MHTQTGQKKSTKARAATESRPASPPPPPIKKQHTQKPNAEKQGHAPSAGRAAQSARVPVVQSAAAAVPDHAAPPALCASQSSAAFAVGDAYRCKQGVQQGKRCKGKCDWLERVDGQTQKLYNTGKRRKTQQNAVDKLCFVGFFPNIQNGPSDCNIPGAPVAAGFVAIAVAAAVVATAAGEPDVGAASRCLHYQALPVLAIARACWSRLAAAAAAAAAATATAR